MTTVDDEEHFLSRWSRRKLEAKHDASAVLPAAQLPVDVPAAPATGATVPGVQQTDGVEYREYFDPKVDEKLRQTALKALFRDPHFNVMDGLDTYIDDYSLADPIPEAMLRRMNQAKGLFLFDEEKRMVEGAGAPATTEDAAPVPEAATTTLPQARLAKSSAEEAAPGIGAVAVGAGARQPK